MHDDPAAEDAAIILQRRQDAERHHEAIMQRLVSEFAWDYRRSMVDLVLVKGLAVPRISGLLHARRTLAARPHERYRETAHGMLELVQHGYSSARGAQVIARMHDAQVRFALLPEDRVYVLTSLMFEPIRWNDRFGRRRFTEAEKYANYCFWREVGKRMQLARVPDSYEACEALNEEYECTMLRRTHASVVLAEALFRALERRAPAIVRSLVRPGISALLDDAVLACFDVAPASRWVRWLIPAMLRLRARLPGRRRRPSISPATARRLRGYVGGYSRPSTG